MHPDELNLGGFDADQLAERIWRAVDAAFGADEAACYEDGDRNHFPLLRAARRKVIAAGAESVLDHPLVEEMIDEAIDDVFERASMATWVAFNGGGNRDELGMARAHAHSVSRHSTLRAQRQRRGGRDVVVSRRTCARQRASRGSAPRTRGSRRVTRSAGDDDPPGESAPGELTRQPLSGKRWRQMVAAHV